MGASLFTRGLSRVPGRGPEGAGAVSGSKDSVLSSRLRSRPDTLGTAQALASDFSPFPEPAEKGWVCCWTWSYVPKYHPPVARMSRPCHCS